jgi:hypothetical protein
VKTLGIITATLTVAAAAYAAALAVRSLPDIRRYLRIRSM